VDWVDITFTTACAEIQTCCHKPGIKPVASRERLAMQRSTVRRAAAIIRGEEAEAPATLAAVSALSCELASVAAGY
jgi:hypothetical protein